MIMALLYFVSDLVLAILFEPLILLFIYISRHVPFLAHMRETNISVELALKLF